jgi:HEAT repeat protein
MSDRCDAETGPAVLINRAIDIEDLESEERWDLIGQLHKRTDPVAFDAALAAACSPDIWRRLVGIDVLGQIGYAAERPYRAETLPVLIAASEHAGDIRLIRAAVTALGHLGDVRARAAVLRRAAHPDTAVRFAVAFALPLVTDPAAPDAGVVETLIGLTRDADPDVRDWATFGIGSQLDADTPAVRDALAARLDDPSGDIAGEALLGLARRRDRRVLGRLMAWLNDEPGNLIVEAAAELAVPEALPALLRLKADHWEDDEPSPGLLDEAIAACRHGNPRG